MSEQREQFQRRIEELVARFETDVDRNEWITRRYPKRMRDEDRSVYEVPALYLQKGPTRLLLDPIGWDVPGTEGCADIYQMPAYDPRASVYYEGGQWVIRRDFPLDPDEPDWVHGNQPVSLSTETINQVLDWIADNAVPSV